MTGWYLPWPHPRARRLPNETPGHYHTYSKWQVENYVSYFKPSYFLNYFNFNNVRFEVGKKICLSISGHHPETWQVKKSSLVITSLSITSKKFNYFLSSAILVHKNCSFGHHWIHAKSRTGEICNFQQFC